MLGMPADRLRAPSLRYGIAGFANPPDWLHAAMVRTVGIEPTLPFGKKILSLQRLPFRHVR